MECRNKLVTFYGACPYGQLFDQVLKRCDQYNKVKCYTLQGTTCFGAKGNSYGKVNMALTGYIESFRLFYMSGYLNCNIKNRNLNSNWGCNRLPNKVDNNFGTWITTTRDRNGVVFPGSNISTDKWKFYHLPGFSSTTSKSITMNVYRHIHVQKGEELRVWYGEDLFDTQDTDNGGRLCVEVWAKFDDNKPYSYFV